ncbi:thiamine diphosphokinase [Enterococcus sp. LJL90]
MEVLMIAGGDLTDWPENLPQADIYVGVDHGALTILELGWPLSLAVGDFDSSTEAERQRIFAEAGEVVTAKAEKDDTDTQLALVETFNRWPTAQVTILGAIGGRLDHFLANLWLAAEPRFQQYAQQICLKNQQNSLSYLLPGRHEIHRQDGFDYLAYCCLTPVSNLTLRNSKYLLDHVEVSVPTSYASNEFISDTAECEFDFGLIAVIQSRD